MPEGVDFEQMDGRDFAVILDQLVKLKGVSLTGKSLTVHRLLRWLRLHPIASGRDLYDALYLKRPELQTELKKLLRVSCRPHYCTVHISSVVFEERREML